MQGSVFSDDNALKLQQLRILEFIDSKKSQATEEFAGVATPHSVSVELPAFWNLTQNISLYSWQEECLDKWFENHRGTVKVVTGAGKTLLALGIIQKLQNTVEKKLRVAIVAPTIVLMNQWYDEFLNHGNLPSEAIGRLGGGYSDDFTSGRRILICVLASAQSKLPEISNASDINSCLLLVVDECHRAGASVMSRLFQLKRRFNLGLSATPERDDEEGIEELPYEKTLLGQELGPIIYELTLFDAIKLGIVPPFKVMHWGLSMNPHENSQYDNLTRRINDLARDLRPLQNKRKGTSSSLFQWARIAASKDKGHTGDLANAYISDTKRRKELLYRIESRGKAVHEILGREFSNHNDATAILFHESIEEVEKLFVSLQEEGFRVVAEHSELPDNIRETSLELFRKGIARVIVSAKSLIEGFNVPSADVGIIVASSSSTRQRIQSLGRVLRKHRTSSGEEKNSCIYILYIEKTSDEAIYRKENWGDITGIDANIYFKWKPGEEPVDQHVPPQQPHPTDTQVDVNSLTPGQEYPGQYEGAEYICDTSGNIKNNQGFYVSNPGQIPSLIIKLRGQAGSFRITPNKRYIIAGQGHGDEWRIIYICQLDHELKMVNNLIINSSNNISDKEWIEKAQEGVVYPFPNLPTVESTIIFKQRRGGVLAKKIPGGEIFANSDPTRGDLLKAKDAKNLVEIIKRLQKQGTQIHKLEINEKRDVLYRANGLLLFIYRLESGLEFPDV